MNEMNEMSVLGVQANLIRFPEFREATRHL